jgi:riboflavin biosynthesis pyrimidine reductase
MERPYIICHMLTSLDGKIIGDFLLKKTLQRMQLPWTLLEN